MATFRQVSENSARSLAIGPEIGCNAVINPGSVIGRDCMIYPSVNFRGVLPHGSVVKLRQELQVVEQRAG